MGGSYGSELATECKQGDASSCVILGWAYQNGKYSHSHEFIPQDHRAAAMYYKMGCDGGYILGCSLLAQLYYDGKGVSQDFSTAAKLYEMACARSDAVNSACLQLAFLYSIGRGVPLDRGKAISMYQTACLQNSPDACKMLEQLVGSKRPSQMPPPTGALGFLLGASLAEVKEACQEASGTWQDIHTFFVCNATYPVLDGKATVALEFENDRLVTMRAYIDINESDYLSKYRNLANTLGGRYGIPTEIGDNVPGHCIDRMLDCIKSKEVKGFRVWHWPDGHMLILNLFWSDGVTRVTLSYSLPGRAAPTL